MPNVVILYIHMHAPRYISTAGLFLVTNIGETLAFTCMVGPALNKAFELLSESWQPEKHP